jgi:hypothetical protein
LFIINVPCRLVVEVEPYQCKDLALAHSTYTHNYPEAALVEQYNELFEHLLKAKGTFCKHTE